jgi:hypothetical protein
MEINRTPWIGCDNNVECEPGESETDCCEDTFLGEIGDVLLGSDQEPYLGYGPPGQVGQPPFVNPRTGQPVPGLTMSGYPNMGYPPIGYAPRGYSPGYPQPQASQCGLLNPYGAMSPGGEMRAHGMHPGAVHGGAVGGTAAGTPSSGKQNDEEEEEEDPQAPTSMMPYPKFHPVPTRPVFQREKNEEEDEEGQEADTRASSHPRGTAPVRKAPPRRQGMNYRFQRVTYPGFRPTPNMGTPYGNHPYSPQGFMNPYQARPYVPRNAYPSSSACPGPYCNSPYTGGNPYARQRAATPPKPTKTKQKKAPDSKKTTSSVPARSRLMLASRQTSPLSRSPQRISRGEPNPYVSRNSYY